MACPFFGRCGGCDFQDDDYSQQLIIKENGLSRVFLKKVVVNPSPKSVAYRSRMDFVFSKGGFGLRAKGNPSVIIPISSCNLVSQRINDLLKFINDFVLNKGFSAYDFSSKKGFLRYLTLRESSLGEVMVIFTTNSPSVVEERDFLILLNSLVSAPLSVNSVYWFVHSGLADDSVVGDVKLSLGSKFIRDSFLGNTFNILPRAFFQSNHDVAELMFSKIKDFVFGRVLDLFCGVGVISVCVADKADFVLGVDVNPDSISSAVINARVNNKGNVSFKALSSDSALKDLILASENFDVVIVDPPRTGLGFNVVSALKQLNPKRIVYMSCNPKTMRDDLALLSDYKEVFFEAFDMFPQTNHVEVLGVFEK